MCKKPFKMGLLFYTLLFFSPMLFSGEESSALTPPKPKRGRKSKTELLMRLHSSASSNSLSQLSSAECSPPSVVCFSNMADTAKERKREEKERQKEERLKKKQEKATHKKTAIEHPFSHQTKDTTAKEAENVEEAEKEKEVENVKEADDADVNLNTPPKEDTEEKEPKKNKKRGRKPKGGKIIQHLPLNSVLPEQTSHVILHLKCSLKDLYQCNSSSFEPFDNGQTSSFQLLANGGGASQALPEYSHAEKEETTLEAGGDEQLHRRNVCFKDIWSKLGELKKSLQTSELCRKASACFWDTCEFSNPPVYIPKHMLGSTYHVYGCFCSPECAVAHLMNENIDASTKFERYHLLNTMYARIYDYKKGIKPAPTPYYMLDKFYGNLTIQEFRSLLQHDHMFMVVDKPMTRVMPEVYEDNDEFLLNSKSIPTNSQQTPQSLKLRLQRKKGTKTTALHERFGGNSNHTS